MKMATGRWGSTLLIAAALLGIAVSAVNYVMPDNGIAGTPGALLVVVSTAALALVAYALRRRLADGRGGGVLWHAIALILLSGTAFAAWLLETPVLVALMALGACAWLSIAFAGGRHA